MNAMQVPFCRLSRVRASARSTRPCPTRNARHISSSTVNVDGAIRKMFHRSRGSSFANVARNHPVAGCV
jgi:hypothetical protein